VSTSPYRWLLPAIVLIAIVTATSLPHPPAMPNNRDKLVHFAAYALLGGSMAWASNTRAMARALLWCAVISLMGAVDEWHQQFVPNRRMDARDWLADTLGGAVGFSLVATLMQRRESVA
jgi:VanZ family protein